MTTRLRCQHLTKEYRTTAGHLIRALDEVSLAVEMGEFVTIVGSSGSGKSTLLRLIAGIEKPSSGRIDHDNCGSDGRIGFVFQGNSVFPWRTVERNLTYASEARHARQDLNHASPADLCRLVGLDPRVFLSKYPRELSGGEERRVAIGIALSAGASLLLFDEATSQLDYMSRLSLQATVQQLWMNKRPTAVYVTHDIEEAVLLGTKIAILSRGQLLEVIPIELPFPRGRDVLVSPLYMEIRDRVLRHM